MSLENKDCKFQSRIEFVLKERKAYPWARSVGIPKGSVDRMLRGYIPGATHLTMIMRAENVSITWLTTGVGAPYIVNWFATDEECRAYLGEMLDFQEWTAHRLTDGGRVDVLVLHAPTTVEHKKSKPVSYTEIHVLAGVGRATLARLADLPSHRLTVADTETVAAVAAGRLAGTWPLLGDEGLLLRYETVSAPRLRVAEDERPDYGGREPEAISAEEQRWLDLIRSLDPHYRDRLREVGDAFAAAAGTDKTGNDDD